MKLSDYVFRYLNGIGINDIFMLCGGGCMHLVDSIGRSRIRYIPCLHEQAATIAAIGYSQYLNKMGVVLVTTGPGGTNTLTGVAGAWADSMPLLILSGQVKTADISGDTGIRMLGFQEVDIVNIVSPVTKYAVTVTEPSEIRYHLEKAVYLANTGRKGPVWLDIPLDVQAAEIEPEKLKGFMPPQDVDIMKMAQMAGRAWNLLKDAERPVILAGYGIRSAHALGEFMELAARLDIPVLTTWKGIDFLSEDHPLYFGRPGSTGQRAANYMIQNCDVLLSIGARMDYGQIGYEHSCFAREAKKIVVDVDESEFRKFRFPIEIPIVGDAGEFIRALLTLGPGKISCGEWKEKGKEWLRKYPITEEDGEEQTDRMSTYTFVDALTRQTGEGFVHAPCCSGVGIEIMLQSMHIKEGVEVVVNCPGLGSMGFGVPNALGVALASGKKTVCVAGDGGFQMNIQELQTIKQLGLPVKFFVLNNDGYGSITNMQRNYFDGYYVGSNAESGLTLPALSGIASAYGYGYEYISKAEELEDKIMAVLEAPGCCICEVAVKEDEKSRPKVSSAIGSDGKMHSRPLEDLWPFLPREVLEKDMIIPPIKEDWE